jgi:hypothetical protein
MKIIITSLILVLAGTVALSQTISVSGTVNNQKGQPVPYAFVRDAQHNYATYADSTGTFMLKVDPASALEVSANGYNDAEVKIENKSSLNVVLPSGVSAGEVSGLNGGNAEVNRTFLSRGQLFIVQSNGGLNTNATVKTGFTQEPTRGSRYLYDNWIHGFGINKKDSLVVEKSNMYNYDKLNGNILYTNDGKSMAQVSSSQIKSFSLFDKNGHSHVYESAPAINGKPFVEVLLSTPKYKIYKKIDTKLTRADFHTDGILEMGHRYDEFVDVERYAFVGADGKSQSISLKKSTLKKLLTGDADAFIAAQGSREVDEDYVKDLGSSLSK